MLYSCLGTLHLEYEINKLVTVITDAYSSALLC